MPLFFPENITAAKRNKEIHISAISLAISFKLSNGTRETFRVHWYTIGGAKKRSARVTSCLLRAELQLSIQGIPKRLPSE